MDELIFSGKYDDWEISIKFDLSGASDQDVAYALAYIHEQIESRAFCHAGIDCDMIEKEIPAGKGIQDMIKTLESRKPGEWKNFLMKASGKEELVPVAETKLVCTLLSKNNMYAKVIPAQSKLKPQKFELFEGQIALVGRYRDWISIKKMGLDEKTQDYEVAGILSGINTTLVKKSFDFMNPDRSVESIAAAATKGKRKSFINLAEALKQIAPSLGGDRIKDAYLLKCVFENLGFPPYANVESLIVAHPDLKAAKPRGRVAKR